MTNTSTTSATINRHQGTNDSATILYATEEHYTRYHDLDKSISVPGGANISHIPLFGLKPNTTYKYQVIPSASPDVFSIRSFQTFPLNGAFTFIVISDSQKGHTYELGQRFKYVAVLLQMSLIFYSSSMAGITMDMIMNQGLRCSTM